MRAALLFATALALLTAGVPVHADPPSEAEVQSRQAFQTAEEHFKAGRFTDALTKYQAGYDLVPLPGFQINIAQCYRRLGDLTRARASYRKFILDAPDSPLVPQVKTLIDELDQLALDLDGTPKPATPAESAPPALQAPASETTAGAPGPALVAVPAAPAASSTSSSRHRFWLWGAVGAAVALAATTTFFVLRTPDANTVHDGTLGTLRR